MSRTCFTWSAPMSARRQGELRASWLSPRGFLVMDGPTARGSISVSRHAGRLLQTSRAGGYGHHEVALREFTGCCAREDLLPRAPFWALGAARWARAGYTLLARATWQSSGILASPVVAAIRTPAQASARP